MKVLTSVSFFRGSVRADQTPLVEITRVNAPDKAAVAFRLEVPPALLAPGIDTCQVTVIDDVAGTFAFPCLQLRP